LILFVLNGSSGARQLQTNANPIIRQAYITNVVGKDGLKPKVRLSIHCQLLTLSKVGTDDQYDQVDEGKAILFGSQTGIIGKRHKFRLGTEFMGYNYKAFYLQKKHPAIKEVWRVLRILGEAGIIARIDFWINQWVKFLLIV